MVPPNMQDWNTPETEPAQHIPPAREEPTAAEQTPAGEAGEVGEPTIKGTHEPVEPPAATPAPQEAQQQVTTAPVKSPVINESAAEPSQPARPKRSTAGTTTKYKDYIMAAASHFAKLPHLSGRFSPTTVVVGGGGVVGYEMPRVTNLLV